ncbi:MAG: hypothetical protein Q9205_006915 [Flavoplaca limonia]
MSAIALLLLAKLIVTLLYRQAFAVVSYAVVSLPGFFLDKIACYTSVGLQEPYASALAISCMILLGFLLFVSVWLIMYLAKRYLAPLFQSHQSTNEEYHLDSHHRFDDTGSSLGEPIDRSVSGRMLQLQDNLRRLELAEELDAARFDQMIGQLRKALDVQKIRLQALEEVLVRLEQRANDYGARDEL